MDDQLEISRTTRYLTIALSLVGVVLACISAYQHAQIELGLNVGPSFCNVSDTINCDAVNASSYAEWFGIPVASFAMAYYLGLIVFVGFALSSEFVTPAVMVGLLIFGGAVTSVVSLALLIVSEFVIGSLCLLCLGLDVVNLALFLVALLSRPKGSSVLYHIVQGAISVAGYIKALFSFGSVRNVPALLMLVGLAILMNGSVNFPYVIARQQAEISQGNAEQQAASYVSNWRKTPVEKGVAVSVGGALGDYIVGPEDAPVTLIEFFDFECPACRAVYQHMPVLLEEMKGKYRFVYKNYPLDQACNKGITFELHQNACFAAEYSRCAGEQGRFKEAVDYLMSAEVLEHDEGKKRPRSKIREVLINEGGERLGLDITGLRECLTSDRQMAKIQQEIAEGDAINLQGTPTFLINGRKVEKLNPDLLKSLVAAELEHLKRSS